MTAVADEIVVQHEFGASQDVDIAREAGIAFDRTVVVPSGSVTATVHDHVITLAGTVDWQYQREEAQRAVASIPGVSGVHNTITITPEVVVSPAEAKAKIHQGVAAQRPSRCRPHPGHRDRHPGHLVGLHAVVGAMPPG